MTFSAPRCCLELCISQKVRSFPSKISFRQKTFLVPVTTLGAHKKQRNKFHIGVESFGVLQDGGVFDLPEEPDSEDEQDNHQTSEPLARTRFRRGFFNLKWSSKYYIFLPKKSGSEVSCNGIQ